MPAELDAQLLAPNAVRQWAAATPDQMFLRHMDGRSLTYREFDALARRWAAVLARRRVGAGTHVAVMAGDHLDAAAAWIGGAHLGAVSVPINTANTGRLLQHVLADSDTEVLVVAPELVDRVRAVAAELPALREVVVSEQRLLDDIEPLDGEAVLPAQPHDIASILYTSGTTGPSKGVLSPWAATHRFWSWVPEDTLHAGEALYCPLPLFHNSGRGALQYVASRGGCLVMRDKFSMTTFWSDVRTSGAVAAGIVGPMTALIYAQPPRADDADNPLRSIILGPMIPEIEAFEARFGVRVATCYGLTEAAGVVVTDWDHGPWDTCGMVQAGWPGTEVRVVDEYDDPVPDGAVGELVVRTEAPWVLSAGYYKRPDATAKAWRNGWFHTGDAFRCDDKGRYYFVDRMKDTIRRRGENISSFEVEALVSEHPAVAECAAFAVPAEHGGDEVMVAVVVATGAEFDPAEVIAFLEPRMPHFMLPRYLDVVDEIPRNSTSLRVQKHLLRERGITATTWEREATSRQPC